MKREFSAGGVLVHVLDGHPVMAAIRPGGKPEGLWALPKGRIGEGEKPEATAVREVEEETGHAPRLLRFAGYTLYVAKRRPKLVLYWHMAADGASSFKPNREVDRVEWLSPTDALGRLTHAGERRLVARAARRR